MSFILNFGLLTARITLFFIFAWRLHPKSREGKGNVGQPFILGRTFTLDRSTAWRPRMQSQESAVWTLLPMESSPILDREEVLIGEESMDMKASSLGSEWMWNKRLINCYISKTINRLFHTCTYTLHFSTELTPRDTNRYTHSVSRS